MTVNVPEPVEGKYIFEVDTRMRIRFNADGWVEEIGKGGKDDDLGTNLQGKPHSKLDDILARRYYDLYTRCVLLDIHPVASSNFSGSEGLILFKDLEQGSKMYERVQLIITIANHHFDMDIKPLA